MARDRADDAASGFDEIGVAGWGDAEFCGDGELAGMALKEFAEAGFGVAVAVHGGDVEVADAGVVGGLEEGEGFAEIGGSHEAGAAVAEASGLAARVGEWEGLHAV